jgi:hypothetical protein
MDSTFVIAWRSKLEPDQRSENHGAAETKGEASPSKPLPTDIESSTPSQEAQVILI